MNHRWYTLVTDQGGRLHSDRTWESVNRNTGLLKNKNISIFTINLVAFKAVTASKPYGVKY